jgi:hypothetical protein
MPGGAIRNAIFRRSAASATSGVESSAKAAERDCCFTPPKNHGIEKSKIRNYLPSLKTTACRQLAFVLRVVSSSASAAIPASFEDFNTATLEAKN